MIRTDNVFYEYKSNQDDVADVKAINGISLKIEQGEFVVILGRNGSGKSTLVRLFNALLIPLEGTVIVDGMDTCNGELVWEIRKTLGLVFQNPDNQIVATTVEEDVAFGPENLGLVQSEIRKRVDKSLELVDMDQFATYSPHMLSGGQKQRIAIAGILAMQPKCIVLDEATSMLDPSGRKEVMDVLHSLNKERGITIILITHHMSEAIEADRALIINEGKVVLQGTPKYIFKKIDIIRNAGLSVPQVTLLAHRLSRKGIFIDELPISIDGMENKLRDIFKTAGIKADEVTRIFQNQKNLIFGDDLSENKEDIISLKNLSHEYMPGTTFSRKAIKNVTLTIKKGEIFGIIGHTGSGKSTLVQHFNGILKATSGTLTVDGLSASGKDLLELRKKVGLVFQYPEQQLFDETVYKDIAFGLIKRGMSEEEIKSRIFHVIEQLGIPPEILSKSPFELSGGQKRRVAIAGVLAMEPQVLVLDEPTAGLDPQGSSEVFKILHDLNKHEGTTIVIISHSMDDIASICHRVAVMDKGELSLCDTTRNVFSKIELLKSCGLGIPAITELFERIKAWGINIPYPVLTVEEAENIILRLLNVSGGNSYVQ